MVVSYGVLKQSSKEAIGTWIQLRDAPQMIPHIHLISLIGLILYKAFEAFS